MIEIREGEKIVFKGTKSDAISFLKKNGLVYKNNDIPILILGRLALNMGFDIFAI